jgi:hypothetical protein
VFYSRYQALSILSTCLRGAAVLTPSWLDAYLGAIEPYLASFEPRFLSMVLTSLARLEHQSSCAFMEKATSGCFDSSAGMAEGDVTQG